MKHMDEDALTTAEQTELSSLKAGPQGGEQIPVTKPLLAWLSGMTSTAKASEKTGDKARAKAENCPGSRSTEIRNLDRRHHTRA